MSYADAMRYFRKNVKALSPEPIQTAPSPVEDGSVATPATPVELPPQVPTSKAEEGKDPNPSRGDKEETHSIRSRCSRPPRPVRGANEDDATWKARWRRWQVDEQVAENMLQGAMGPVLRGRPNNAGVCFGNCPAYACTCHEEGPFQL